MRRFFLTILVVVIATIALLITAAALGSVSARHAVAMLRPATGFQQNGPVFQEVLDATAAVAVDRALTQAIGVVEGTFDTEFTRTPEVYLPATLDRFEGFCARRNLLGCVVRGRLFVTPDLVRQPDTRLPVLLTHEAVHLLLLEQLSLKQLAVTPAWFSEGLAEYVSKGPVVDECTIVAEIRDGAGFFPNDTGWLLAFEGPESFGLSLTVFYRQARGFVSFLARRDPAGFGDVLQKYLDGQSVKSAINQGTGASTEALWREWLAGC